MTVELGRARVGGRGVRLGEHGTAHVRSVAAADRDHEVVPEAVGDGPEHERSLRER